MVRTTAIIAAFVACSFLSFSSAIPPTPLGLLVLTPVVSTGGLVIGIIGLALGGIGAGMQLAGLLAAENEDDMMRRKRSAGGNEDVTKAMLEIENYTDSLYQEDRTQCIEKLVCDITKRSRKGEIEENEEDILKLTEINENKGVVYKKMLIAEQVAFADGDCEFIFDSCPLETSEMVGVIRDAAQRVSSYTSN